MKCRPNSSPGWRAILPSAPVNPGLRLRRNCGGGLPRLPMAWSRLQSNVKSERNQLMLHRHAVRYLLGAGLACGLMLQAVAATQNTRPAIATSGYDKPPANILSVMEAAQLPTPSVNPTHDALLLITTQWYPSIARV